MAAFNVPSLAIACSVGLRVCSSLLTKGVYHQGRELERVLGVKHNVVLCTFQHLPNPDPANDTALYIIMPAFATNMLPPNYILYQTEQWGHETLSPHSAIWANQRGNETQQTTLDAFEVNLLPCTTAELPSCLPAQCLPELTAIHMSILQHSSAAGCLYRGCFMHATWSSSKALTWPLQAGHP